MNELKTGWQAVTWEPTFSGPRPEFSEIYDTERECRLRHQGSLVEIREVIVDSGREK